MVSKKLKKELIAAIIGSLSLRSAKFRCTKNDNSFAQENCHIFISEDDTIHEMYIQRLERTTLQALLFRPHRWSVIESEEYTELFYIDDRKNSKALQKIFDKKWEEQEAEGRSDAETKQIVLRALRLDAPKEEEKK